MYSWKKTSSIALYSLVLIAVTAIAVTCFNNQKPSTTAPQKIDLHAVHEKRLQALVSSILSENQSLSNRVNENSNHISIIVEEIVRLIRETDKLSAKVSSLNNEGSSAMTKASHKATHAFSPGVQTQNYIEIPSPLILNHEP